MQQRNTNTENVVTDQELAPFKEDIKNAKKVRENAKLELGRVLQKTKDKFQNHLFPNNRSFYEWCEEEFQFKKSYINKLIHFASLHRAFEEEMGALVGKYPNIETEPTCRLFAGRTTREAFNIWRGAVELAHGKTPTHAQVNQAINKWDDGYKKAEQLKKKHQTRELEEDEPKEQDDSFQKSPPASPETSNQHNNNNNNRRTNNYRPTRETQTRRKRRRTFQEEPQKLQTDAEHDLERLQKLLETLGNGEFEEGKELCQDLLGIIYDLIYEKESAWRGAFVNGYDKLYEEQHKGDGI